MARGKYTAYQLYQNSQFQQANRAKVEPYTQSAYKCPHSQRALMQQFQDYSQRTHYDAAYLGCCDEPVQIFGIHPQYADELNPPAAKECSKKPTEQPCYVARLQQIGTLNRCSDEGSVLSTGRISIECHQACREFANIPKNGGTWVGRYGTLTIIGTKGNTALLEYKLKDTYRAAVWDGCLDNQTYTEYFCNQAITFSVSGGLASPENCYCDCCGLNGVMSVPTLLITAQNSPVGQDIWSNTWDFGTILATGVCKDYYGFGGSFYSYLAGDYANGEWTSGPTYTPSTRSVTGTHAGAGSQYAPVCCGGIFQVAISDPTCGNYDSFFDPVSDPPGTHTGYFDSMITTPIAIDVDPPGFVLGNVEVLSDNNIYTFTATPACSYSYYAGMGIANKIWKTAGVDYDCSESEIGTTQNGDGSMTIEVTTHIKNTAGCKACCGRAKMEATATDGCGDSAPTKTYWIYGDYEVTNPWIGWKVFCQWDGVYWKEYKDKLYCDGSLEGSPSLLSAINHSTEANCKLGLNSNAPGLCGSGGHSDCTTCCHYAMNVAGTSGKVVCALSTTCCDWEQPDPPYYVGAFTYGNFTNCCTSRWSVANP